MRTRGRFSAVGACGASTAETIFQANSFLVRFLIDAPRWLLLLALFYAPWAFGCTRVWTVWGLDLLLGLLLVLWGLGIVLVRGRWRRVEVPAALWIPVGLLLLLGWGMVINSPSLQDSEQLVFVPLTPWIPAGGRVGRSGVEPGLDVAGDGAARHAALCGVGNRAPAGLGAAALVDDRAGRRIDRAARIAAKGDRSRRTFSGSRRDRPENRFRRFLRPIFITPTRAPI